MILLNRSELIIWRTSFGGCAFSYN